MWHEASVSKKKTNLSCLDASRFTKPWLVIVIWIFPWGKKLGCLQTIVVWCHFGALLLPLILKLNLKNRSTPPSHTALPLPLSTTITEYCLKREKSPSVWAWALMSRVWYPHILDSQLFWHCDGRVALSVHGWGHGGYEVSFLCGCVISAHSLHGYKMVILHWS